MPGGDRTGPMGAGPMTGRGAGFCAGYGMPGTMQGGRGRGLGGRGRGWRHGGVAIGQPGRMRFGDVPAGPPAVTAEQEQQAIEQQVQALQQTVASLEKRLSELKSESS